jgi:hypothetical protein
VSYYKWPADQSHELIVETLWTQWGLWYMVWGGHRHEGWSLPRCPICYSIRVSQPRHSQIRRHVTHSANQYRYSGFIAW